MTTRKFISRKTKKNVRKQRGGSRKPLTHPEMKSESGGISSSRSATRTAFRGRQGFVMTGLPTYGSYQTPRLASLTKSRFMQPNLIEAISQHRLATLGTQSSPTSAPASAHFVRNPLYAPSTLPSAPDVYGNN